MIYFITHKEDPQVRLFYKLAKKNNIPGKIIDLSDTDLKISISPDGLLINNKLPEEGSVIFLNNIQYEFPHIPEEPLNNDWMLFQDFHAAQQQQKSHIYSMLSILSENEKYTIINNFLASQKFVVKSYILQLLSEDGLDIPNYILTNSRQRIENSDLFNDKEDILWSYPGTNSPIRKINKKRLDDLIKADNPLPFIFIEDKKGYAARVIYFNKFPVLIVLFDKPSDTIYEERLENFNYIIPQDNLQELGNRLFNIFGLEYYEIDGIIDDDERFWFYNISFNPNITGYSQKVQQYILSKLLVHFTRIIGDKVSIKLPVLKSEVRKTIFLKRMLKPLFEIQSKTE